MEGKLRPKPPEHLKEAGRDFFKAAVTEYKISDPARVALLVTACECLDRMRAAQEAIEEHGETVLDRYGRVKLNPACTLERDARNGFLSALRALDRLSD